MEMCVPMLVPDKEANQNLQNIELLSSQHDVCSSPLLPEPAGQSERRTYGHVNSSNQIPAVFFSPHLSETSIIECISKPAICSQTVIIGHSLSLSTICQRTSNISRALPPDHTEFNSNQHAL